jgi:Protein of unknown function (DUF2924)
MPPEIGDRLALLSGMNKTQLIDFWNELFKVPPPHQLRRNLLIRFAAYRMQEKIHGGLSPATRKRLREFARKFAANPDAELSEAPRIKPGIHLVRDWRGRSHSVIVLENGYEYAGKRYSSLSQVARLITGTRWSGPLFFGLRGDHAKKHVNAQRT